MAAVFLLTGLLAGDLVSQQGPVAGADPFATPWWDELADPGLTELLRVAVSANGDLGAAVERILEAEAQTRRARSALFPTLSVDGQANTGPIDGLGFQFGGIPQGGDVQDLPARFYTGSINARASYRLSAWGQEYRSMQASRLEEMARRGDEDGVALDLIGQVATAYYDAVAAARQVAVITEQVESGSRLAQVIQLRFERGEGTALDVLQQRQQVATVRSTLPPARAELRLAQTRLESLLGRDPTATTVALGTDLPAVPDEAGQAIFSEPAARPDLRGAQDRLDAAGVRVSEAKWSYAPTIDLSANTGSQFFRSVGTTTQSTWGASLSVSLPLFDGLDRSGRTREASANERAARSSYEQLRRDAAAETMSAGIQREEQQAQLEALREQLQASERAFQESRRRYLAGLATVLDVLVAMDGMQQSELSVIRTQRSLLGSWIEFRQAMGGPWTTGIRARLLEVS
jgi:NodT family efflux transporter outer membrane factor (OMF) lipoprotein